jgi:phage tail-like protein
MEENKNMTENTRPGWMRMVIAGGSGLVLGFLVIAANGILGGPIQFNTTRPAVMTNQFRVEIPGINLRGAEFVSMSGISSASEEIPPPEEDPENPDQNLFVTRVPGPLSFQPVTLQRVFRGPDELSSWRNRVESGGAVEKRDVHVTLLDARNMQLRRVILVGAYPSGWELPSVGAGGQASLEKITFHMTEAIEVR